MGEPRDLQHPAFPRLSSQLGDQLLGLYKKDCPASKEFQYMGHEFKAFHASYQIIRPYLQQPSDFISEVGLNLVRSIHDGVEAICEDIIEDVHTFAEQLERAKRVHENRVNSFFLLHGGKSTARDRNKRVLRFFEDNNYTLQRCQLRYGNMLLNLMLAVFVYAQCMHDVEDEAAFPDTSAYLIADLYTALTELRSRERREKRASRRNTLLVEAGLWWDGLPPNPPNMEPLAPMAILTRIWVNPEARLAANPAAGAQGFQDIIRQWRERSQQQRSHIIQLDTENQQLSGAMQQLTSDNVQLQQDNELLRTDNDTLRQATDRLHRDISRLIEEIQTERNARNRQEQDTNYYRERHDAVHQRYTALLAENERAKRHSRGGGVHEELPEIPHANARERERDRLHHRDSTPRDPPLRSSQPRTSHRSQHGPPVAYDTQKRDRRRSSSSSNRSNRSSDRWSRTSTAVETPTTRSRRNSSPKAPPIPIHTRPFRTGF
ncbi:hypothetical protein K505DRAFT_370443 [Melanomma pulvis-pyrius CBS 109.77]|uniref:Uncharacterized protein n=1 Tax=Melanomma pulvis-pyrius CBS 109.77 TaxID=1314802 RepID=A0A6A6XUM1_9PLEO|nr:hypothetical protein K505DRAFT_370443 [Melanomma pulvis-pyrius CBS 109.77]